MSFLLLKNEHVFICVVFDDELLKFIRFACFSTVNQMSILVMILKCKNANECIQRSD